MRAISPSWSASSAQRPTAAEVTRARFSVAALGAAVLLPLLVALGMEIRGTSTPHASGVRTLAEHQGPGLAWAERLQRLDEAIQMRNMGRAVFQWYEAYGEALRSRNWKALLDVGDRAIRIDGLLPRTGTFREEARRSYLSALFRARSEGSTAGILGTADAFERLGDAEAASAARRMLPRRL